ncbi:terminase small subunit [Cetobacterium sp.]|uniref:terminase small subunit n=2 Tax=Cetobacterium sp. TaxID=2071632 RepID=UPI003EE71998
MEKYELAELDYKNGMKYKDIADKYEVSLNTVKSWKTRYKWCKDDKKVCTQKTKKVCTQKKGAVPQNKSEELNENIEIKHISEVIDEYELDEVIGENLTDKQKLFCWYYARTFNVRSSALKAGYSIHYATSKIYDLIQHEKIKFYLDEIRKKMFSKVEASAELLYERHCSIAFADTADFLNPDGSLRNLNEVDGSLVKKVTSNVKKETVERFGVDGETTSLKTIDEVKTSIELEDRSKSLDFLTKFHGLDPSFKNQKEKLNLEKDKISVLEERNKILENANKPPSTKVEDMSEDSKINLLKKYGGA